ncbi:MAG: hydrolase 1, exosortase A system-associated [Alphaproteobacteria bacterium]|nr:MAG: hydrolase 1, exosortase A system-associated [Alphaproteobacteria bacterium]
MSRGTSREGPVLFTAEGATCIGIVHRPPVASRTGVVIVVGGPQYRVGAHRSFVTLARSLADAGFAVFRFDYRGLGDSEGEDPGFEALGPDIAAAIDAFHDAVPEVARVVLWGLCDGATASVLCAADDPRVAGLVLLNPWVHEEAAYERVLLRHYYRRRIVSRDFWRQLARGRVKFLDFPRLVIGMIGRGFKRAGEAVPARLADRFLAAAGRHAGPVLLVTSGHDLTAREFLDAVGRDSAWRAAIAAGRVRRLHVEEADHTFSEPGTLEQVIAATRDWLEGLDHSS